MFGFLKSKKDQNDTSAQEQPKQSWGQRLKSGLKRTRSQFGEGLSRLVLGKKSIDAELLEELETQLLMADIGVDVSQTILEQLRASVKRRQLDDPSALITELKSILVDLLKPSEQPLTINQAPFVILMVGVNGAGKTTSIAKLAHYYKEQDRRIILAAGDTFRAAAVEQLQVWGERNQVPVIAQHSGADSASVIYDAMASAQAKNFDMLIADTAGRLHTQSHLMEELKKIKRVMSKLNPEAPHETLLVLDAGIGQNALNQALQFHEAIGVTGLAITKLDGTAKGGIIFAITDKLKLPIRFIGVGEQIDDLRPFHAEEFVDALFE